MEIRFRKKTKSEWAVLFIFIMPFLLPLLTDVFRLPDFVKYSIDISWIGLLIGMLNKKTHIMFPTVRKLLIICNVFFASTLIGFLLNFQSVFYYLWGIRNNLRFFVYFFACIFFIRAESAEYYLKFLDKVFWINAPIMMYQFFVLGYQQDYLGGIFGTDKGCNGYTNILFIIVTARAILYCLNNKESLSKCLLKCAVAILLAAIAELKAFFIEFIIIVVLAMCFTKASYKKFWITVASICSVIVGIRIIEVIFPVFKDWFSLEKIYQSLTSDKGYTSTNDINRLTVYAIALERFLTSVHQKLFGLGLGNCDYASFDFLITPFYRRFGGLNYAWFSSAMMILETGLIGSGLYIFFFVRLFLTCWKNRNGISKNKLHNQLSMICAVMCGCLFIINSSLRSESGFMMFFVLSLPFIAQNTAVTVSN